ncbi:MAG: HAD family hydrolase [Fibrobacter sp.]|nr:HAD family hydrolase [Fibrobacter sp.]HON11441.1 HAD family hydrolase [Chitinispirillaceae bacterium]
MRKALFLDRDGVINEDRSYPYLPEQIVFMDGIFDLCRKALDKGYIIIVITNQAGVARGFFTEENVKRLHEWMSGRFREQGVEISAFYYCPYHPKAVLEEYRVDSDCRKPAPGMVLQAIKDFSIDISRSLVVGDKPSDRINLDGLRSVIIKSRYTGEDYDVESLSDVEQFL